ncbi:MAG: hypothetical protein KatS3mg060_0069 [Dehalococcoidia bacterium]|nr:MAG: hypothetical protein KatS3mg060_0069 [Dehalococcoidia bacterium]
MARPLQLLAVVTGIILAAIAALGVRAAVVPTVDESFVLPGNVESGVLRLRGHLGPNGTLPRADGVRLAGLDWELREIAIRDGGFTAARAETTLPAPLRLAGMSDGKLALVDIVLQDGRLRGRLEGAGLRIGDELAVDGATVTLDSAGDHGTGVLEIVGTLRFAGMLDGTSRTVLRVTPDGGRPRLAGSMAPTLARVGPVVLSIGEAQLDAAHGGWTFHAGDVRPGWNAEYGGLLGDAVGPLVLGQDAARTLRFTIGEGGPFALPAFRTPFLVSGPLAAQAVVDHNTLVLTVESAVDFNVAGGALDEEDRPSLMPLRMRVARGALVQEACAAGDEKAGRCLPAFSATLPDRKIVMAGFDVFLSGVRMREGGGFIADRASIVPGPAFAQALLGKAAGHDLRDLEFDARNRLVRVSGGLFALPAFSIKGISIPGAAVRVETEELANGRTVFAFEGRVKAKLPGLGDGKTSPGIDTRIRIRSNPETGGFAGLGGDLNYTGPPGIPLGPTGVTLQSMGGGFDVGPETATLRFHGGLAIADIPRLGAEGELELFVLEPRFKASLAVTLWIVTMGSADFELGKNVGWPGAWSARIGGNGLTPPPITLPVRTDFTVAQRDGRPWVRGDAEVGLFLRRNQISTFIPPSDINLGSVRGRFGRFDLRGSQDSGILGTFQYWFFGQRSASFFLSFEGRGLRLVNQIDYRLLGQREIQQLADRGVAGFRSLALERGPLDDSGRGLFSVEVPITVSSPAGLTAGVTYTGTATITPTLRLVLPDGSTLTVETVVSPTTNFLIQPAETITQETALAFFIEDPQPGTYRLLIDHAPAGYHVFNYQMVDRPELTSATAARSGSRITVTWQGRAPDAPAVVAIGYARREPNGLPDFASYVPLATGLPVSGTTTIDLTGVPSGTYLLVVDIEDDYHDPFTLTPAIDGAPTFSVTDIAAPPPPSGLSVTPLWDGFTVTFSPSPTTTGPIAGYLLGVAISPTGTVVMTEDLEIPYLLPTGQLTFDYLGMDDGQEVWIALRAYDFSGNVSDWTPLVRAASWSFGPTAVYPLPGSAIYPFEPVAIVFDVAIAFDSLRFSLATSDGTPIAGRLEPIVVTDAPGEVVGARFIPTSTLPTGKLKATLGARAQAIAGGTTPEALVWEIVVEPFPAYLPFTALREVP